MADTLLSRIKEIFSAYQTVYQSLSKAANVRLDIIDKKWKALKETTDEKEFKKGKQELLKLYDPLIKLGPEIKSALDRWHEYGGMLQKELDVEIQKREKAYKEDWDNAEAVKRVNKIIQEKNKTLPKDKQIKEEEPIEASTEAVADIKSVAAEVMLWMKFIEDKQKRVDSVQNAREDERKKINNFKFKPPKK